MAKVRYRGKEFVKVDAEYIIPAVYEYAKTDDTIYDAVLREKVSLYLNGEIVDVDDWCITEVTDSDEILVTPLISGGEGGFLQTVIGAILTAAAFIIAGPAGIAQASLWVQGMALVGTSMILGGLSQLLFKPTLPDIKGNSTDSQTYNWSGIKTTAQVDSPINVVYGTHIVGGNVIGIYTESIGGDNYLNMLIAMCEGEIEGICKKDDISSVCTTSYNKTNPYILLDDQLIEVYDDVVWWYRTGTNTKSGASTSWNDSSSYVEGDVVSNDNQSFICISANTNKEPNVYSSWETYWTPFEHYPFAQNVIPRFNNSIIQYDDGREITSNDYIQYSTIGDVDRVILQLKSPSLYKANSDDGDITPYTITYKVDYKKSGDVSWIPLSVKSWNYYLVGLTREDGTLSNSKNISVAYYNKTNVVGMKPPTITIEILGNTFEDFSECNSESEKTYRIDYSIYDESTNILETSFVTQTITRSTTYQHAHHWDGGEVQAGWICGPTRYKTTKIYFNQYEMRLKHNLLVGDKFQISSTEGSDSTIIEMEGKTKSDIWTSIEVDINSLNLVRDSYDIRIIRTDAGPSDSFYVSDQLILNSVTEIISGTFIYPNTALLGLRIRATEQLSGSPPNVNILVKGTKIAVPDIEDCTPSGTNYTFSNCFWSEDNSRWETPSCTELYWNNTNSWRTEHSDNAILCVRDYITNRRYGLGKYLTTSDLYSAGLREAIQDCHVNYNPQESIDIFDWWNNSTNVNWATHVRLYARYGNPSVVLDSSTRQIDINANSDYSYNIIHINLHADTTLVAGNEYKLSITTGGFGGNEVLESLRAYYERDGGFTLIGNETNITSNTTLEMDFTPLMSTSMIRLRFYISSFPLIFSITDIALDTNQSGIHYHTYNGVMDTKQSANIALLEMCDSFRCWPVLYEGVYNFIINKDVTPVHTLTMSNINNFTQTFTPLSEIPYRIISQFSDKSNRYKLRSLIGRSKFTDLNKLNETNIGLKGITDIRVAERETIFKLNYITNCTHNISCECKLDFIHGTAGDVISIQNDLPSWGQGGRVLSYTSTDITIDNPYTFTNVATDNFSIKYQKDDNTFVTASVDKTSISNNDSLMTIPIEAFNGSPCNDSVYTIGVTSNLSKDFRLTSVKRSGVDSVSITGIEHLPDVYEATLISVIDDPIVTPPNIYGIPGSPIGCSVKYIENVAGVGFNLKAYPPNDGTNVKDIVIQIKTENGEYQTIAYLPSGTSSTNYINNNLLPNTYYTFRFYCRTEYKSGISNAVIITAFLGDDQFILPKPTGIYIKGNAPIDTDDYGRHRYEDKDINLAWNIVSGSVTGYYIEIYYDTIANTNLLRTANVTSNEYTYFYDNNIEDSGGTPHSNIIFILFTVGVNNVKSKESAIFNTINTSPSIPTGASTTSIVGGVQLSWGRNTERDLKEYSVAASVGTGSYSSYVDTIDVTYTKHLTATEISDYGSGAEIAFKLKAVDLFDQESNVASGFSANANIISDNIFQISGSMSGSFGTVASLYDGNLTATAITIV